MSGSSLDHQQQEGDWGYQMSRVLSAPQPFVNTQDVFFTCICVCDCGCGVCGWLSVFNCLYCGHKQFVSLMMTGRERSKDMNGQTEGHVGVDGEVFRLSWPQVNQTEPGVRAGHQESSCRGCRDRYQPDILKLHLFVCLHNTKWKKFGQVKTKGKNRTVITDHVR